MNANDHKPKTLKDFPQFIVATIHHCGTGSDGYARVELDGKFDRLIDESEGNWFFLLTDSESICATLKSLDKETKTATLTCDEKDEPKIAGKALAYLNRFWRPHHVWMILDRSWGWERKQFQGSDAVADAFESKDVSIVDGQEVRVWNKLRPVNPGHATRYYPASDQSSPPGSEPQLVAGGWDHEHCALCNAHIDVAGFGYCGADGRWLCEKCYERYVMQRDLSFTDEL